MFFHWFLHSFVYVCVCVCVCVRACVRARVWVCVCVFSRPSFSHSHALKGQHTGDLISQFRFLLEPLRSKPFSKYSITLASHTVLWALREMDASTALFPSSAIVA